MQHHVRRFAFLVTAFCASTPFVCVEAVPGLSKSDVETIVAQAAAGADQVNKQSVIAVTDREGFLLALWDAGNRFPQTLPTLDLTDLNPDSKDLKTYGRIADAITKASTAAFLSSDQNAFTTRTAGYIIQQHFPVGVRNAGPGPLVGVGFSSLFFSDVNRVKLIPQGFRGDRSIQQLIADGFLTLAQPGDVPPLLGVTPFGDLSPGVRAPLFPLTSLNDSPGGVPLYKGGHLVGGIGVTGDGDPTPFTPAVALLLGDTQKSATTGYKTGADPDEEIALLGQTGFRPANEIHATNVLINGIRVPYVDPRPEDILDIDDVPPLGTIGHSIDVPFFLNSGPNLPAPLVPNQALFTVPASVVAKGAPQASPDPYPYEVARLGGFEGEIRFPFRDDPLLNDGKPGNDLIGSARRLQKDEVKEIISLAAERARITRAGIRIPIGTSVKVFISVVSNPNKQGGHPQILGVFRTGEATVFSWDVAVQKARTAVLFSNTQLAMSSRTVGFLAQRFFPPGIDGTSHGPYFGFQEAVTLKTRAGGGATAGTTGFLFPGNPNTPNGITVFPGGFPLYKDGFLVGAIGISGDGVDQDDIIGISGTEDFQADRKIRADQFTYRGARLPYVKFPRDPVR